MMLQAENLTKSYAGIRVLGPVGFFLPQGECLGVTGGNGSGKSTLLRLLAQIERPDTGDILYGGKSVLGNREFIRKKIGYVPQNNELAESLTVRQQLKLWQSACGRKGAIDPGVLSMLGMEELYGKRISTLSGGMKKRVSICMALLTHPGILIMDEATSGLDGDYCQALLNWVEAYLGSGGSVIWCSHHPEEIRRLCGSVIKLGNEEPKE